MDDFHQSQAELTGSLISLEFDSSGRINQLWTSDPTLPEDGDEFQFILPPITFGEEAADHYYPGTILIGARTSPESPWVLSRNTQVSEYDYSLEDSFDFFDPSSVNFQYQFPLLPEIEATGKFYEIAKPIPQILWDVTLTNQHNESIEIGELAFPLALNNYYDGFGWTDEQLEKLWHKRLYIHQFISGAASWLIAQRMNAEPPSLLIYPGNDTEWEFYSHVPSSLNTHYQWEGIPVVYVHSKATMEREEWPDWANRHTSLILEPGEQKTFQMRFIPTEQSKQDGIHQVLKLCHRPAVKVYPSCVIPKGSSIGIEVSGMRVTSFESNKPCVIQPDIDDDTSFCLIKPETKGPMTISFEDHLNRKGYVHLFATDSIKDLIHKRASYIQKNQDHDPTSTTYGSFLMRYHPAITVENEMSSQSAFERYTTFDLDSSIADALFLAEKNTIYPNKEEIGSLDTFIHTFLRGKIQNPLTMEVGSSFNINTGIVTAFGKPIIYPHVFNLYFSMYKISQITQSTKASQEWYLTQAIKTILTLFERGWRNYVLSVGLLGYGRIYTIFDEIQKASIEYPHLNEYIPKIKYWIDKKSSDIIRQKYPYAGESVMDTSGFEDVLLAAKYDEIHDHMDRTIDCAYSARSIAPSWWWYGSDKRNWDGIESNIKHALGDRGEMCLAHTTIPNSFIFTAFMDRDYFAIPDAHMRLAFGGLMGPWALVHDDGSASLCYCPDYASKHRGFNPFSGSSSLGYYHYLHMISSMVLPSGEIDTFSLGCHFDHSDNMYAITPWDGVGRRIHLRQIGIDVDLSFGTILYAVISDKKDHATFTIQSNWENPVDVTLSIRGLWGDNFKSSTGSVSLKDSAILIQFTLQETVELVISSKVLTLK